MLRYRLNAGRGFRACSARHGRALMHQIIDSLGRWRSVQVEIWDDSNAEKPGFYRAYWVEPGTDSGIPIVGFCSPGGSHPTIRECIAEIDRMGYGSHAIYRNGRVIRKSLGGK